MSVKRLSTLCLFFAVVATFANIAIANNEIAKDTISKDVVMQGSYKWVRKKKETSGTITATFTPAGDNKWTVVFKFDWNKTPHIYTGTATGTLTDGKIEGKVLNDKKKRTFTFTGTVKDGTLKASHKEIKKRRGKEIPTDTGTIEMKIS